MADTIKAVGTVEGEGSDSETARNTIDNGIEFSLSSLVQKRSIMAGYLIFFLDCTFRTSMKRRLKRGYINREGGELGRKEGACLAIGKQTGLFNGDERNTQREAVVEIEEKRRGESLHLMRSVLTIKGERRDEGRTRAWRLRLLFSSRLSSFAPVCLFYPHLVFLRITSYLS